MSIWRFLKSLWHSTLSFDDEVANFLPEYRALHNDVLLEQLRTCDYFSLPAAEPGKPNMNEMNAVQALLGSVESGEFRELVNQWPETLGGLRDAERACGYTGRPLLMDCNIHLTCIVRVLADRQKTTDVRDSRA